MSSEDQGILTAICDGSSAEIAAGKDNNDSSSLNCESNAAKFSKMIPPTISEFENDDCFDSDTNELNVLALVEDDPNEVVGSSKVATELELKSAATTAALNDATETEEGTYRGRPSSCVFVASLAASLTDDQLSMSVTKHFEKWGELALVKVLRDPSNRPYAFVQYTNDADAQKALENGHNSTLDGRTIRCEPAKVNRTLYIATCNGLDVSSKDLKNSLEHYGEVEQMVGNNDSHSRKFNLNNAWFCKFAYRDDAIRAYANLRVSPDYIVEWAQNIDKPSPSVAKFESFSAPSLDEPEVVIDKFSVFIGQLDASVTKEKLSERFSRHGKIEDIVLVLKPGNNFAFIKFTTEKAAGAAVERENHAVFLEKTMHVQYRELHHKKSRSVSLTSPRLNLAPPPVNLPYRRASVGSSSYIPKSTPYDLHSLKHYQSVYHPSSSTINSTGLHSSGSNKKSYATTAATTNPPSMSRGGRFKNSLSRSASFDNHHESFKSGQRFFSQQYGSGLSVIEGNHYSSYKTNSITGDVNTPSKGNGNGNTKQTPLSSPSNHTNESSQGESKSMYSPSTVSALEHQLQDASLDAHHLKVLPSLGVPRPPSSYYYYAPVSSHGHAPPRPPGLQKEPYIYEPSNYLSYSSYSYYYPNNALMEYPAGSLNPTPAPYYMYYGVPQTPSGFSNGKSVASNDLGHYENSGHQHHPPMSPKGLDY
ncbi:hypothetical protein WICPIJ_004687 [Wickerhamomyces pijperi]|uniref:RRM domain-containing protein n=1 Tax=Wickerhamomyces pijperi TaxID=599730 RepID=A0A9P8Q5D5_WICPI|nr:hypothetical protein WICPIJ_004687 [Wickerhamomyces pijperi]